MSVIVTRCPLCGNDVDVPVASAVLRTDREPVARGELLYHCSVCHKVVRQDVGSELLALLLLEGKQPLRLGEPALAPDDVAPANPPLTREDLLAWHESLEVIQFVIPWEREPRPETG